MELWSSDREDVGVTRPNHSFGQTIARLRRYAGLTQEELAHRARIHPTYVSQIERGLKSPTVTVILRLAKALDVSLGELMQAFENTRRRK